MAAPKSLSLCAALLIILPICAPAQQSAPANPAVPRRVPLTIALVRTMPDPQAPFVILRRSRGTIRDIVLLPQNATAAQLSDAIRGVLTARSVAGDSASTSAMLRMRNSAGQRPRTIIPWTERVLADLQRAPPRPLEGIGTVRSVMIWLPPQHHRASK